MLLDGSRRFGRQAAIESAGCVSSSCMFKDLKLPDYLAFGLLGRILLEGAAWREEI